jgi:hypothetical protein
MALLRQYINGSWVNTVNVQASAGDLDALKGLMEGKVQEWETKATGGTATTMPEKLNTMVFGIGNKDQEIRCSFRLHHVNPAKTNTDIEGIVIGNFDAHYAVDTKCDYAHLIQDNR